MIYIITAPIITINHLLIFRVLSSEPKRSVVKGNLTEASNHPVKIGLV